MQLTSASPLKTKNFLGSRLSLALAGILPIEGPFHPSIHLILIAFKLKLRLLILSTNFRLLLFTTKMMKKSIAYCPPSKAVSVRQEPNEKLSTEFIVIFDLLF